MAPYPYFLLLVFVLQVTQQFQFSALELAYISSDEFETKMSLGVNDIRFPVATSFLDDFADGGTWAFATGDSLSSLNKILFGGLANFSAQEFLDCTKKAKGCRSGFPSDAFEYARTHSIAAAADYPFVGEAGACKHKEKQGKVSLKEFESIEGTDKAIEKNMLKAVHNQPLTAVIDGSKAEFKSYAGGIYKGPCAESGSLSVLVVGYGSENGDKYWIIKNSWGTEWGENGYMKLECNSNIFGGRCGIYINVFYPTELGPPPSHFPPPPPPPSPSPPPPSPSPPPPLPRQRCYTQLCKAGEECCCYWAPCKFFHICCPKGKCGITIFYPCKLI
ncbi:mexicain [Selaginella moellendorffii]|nr:mexicain [Selaginella moellendorffii]|eukprot:XP_002980232.2 mexicain [Selaginella moellendorffii]